MATNKTAIFIFILLSAAVANALTYSMPYSKEMFNDFALEKTTYTMQNKENFTNDFVEDNIIINLKQGSIIVKNNSCSQDFNYNICFSGFKFSHYNYSAQDRIVNKAKVSIELNTAKINLTRNITQELKIGKEYRVETSFQNVGDTTAENATFSDYYTNDFEVYLTSDCALYANNVTWKGSLDAKEKVKCEYIIRPVRNTTYSSKAYIGYYDGVQNKIEEITSTLKVNPHSLKVTESITNKELDMGEETSINFTLSTTEDANTQFTIKIPDKIRIVKSDNALSKIDNNMAFSGLIKNNETKLFKITLIAEYPGNYTIDSNAKYWSEGNQINIKTPVQINVSFKQPEIRIIRTDFNTTKGKLSIFVVNPSNHTLNSLELELAGFINGSRNEQSLDGLSHKEYSYEFDKEEGEYELTASIKYKNEFYNKFFDQKTYKISIKTNKEEKREIRTNINTSSTPAKPEEKTTENKKSGKEIKLDLKKDMGQAKKILIIFAALIMLVIILAVIIAKLKGRKSEPITTPELKDLIK